MNSILSELKIKEEWEWFIIILKIECLEEEEEEWEVDNLHQLEIPLQLLHLDRDLLQFSSRLLQSNNSNQEECSVDLEEWSLKEWLGELELK